MKTINCLVVTTLYPNAIQFRHGIFIETRIQQLKQTGNINLTVIAPVAWFPFKSKFFKAYSKLVDIPKFEIRDGITIHHPRYLVIPKIGMWFTPFFLAYSIFNKIKQLKKQQAVFDMIDAHYYYPDGVAAALVSKLLKIPLCITARGSDINLISSYKLPRKMIIWASQVAQFNLAVSDALCQKMQSIGIQPSTLYVMRNGVDLERYRPFADRAKYREKWNIKTKLLLSVGSLIELKGHHLVISALTQLPDFQLFIIGGGEWEQKLKNLAIQLNVQNRVQFIGEIPPETLPEFYNIADALVLASEREGLANVLLESLACGTPLVATNVGGAAEVIQESEAGVLCMQRTEADLVSSIQKLFRDYPDREKTRKYAQRFAWTETSQGLLNLYNQMTV